MNEFSIFQNPDFGQIRITQDAQGEPLFCLKDVCKALLLDGKQVTRRLDGGVVSKHPIVDSLGRTQMVTFVNEDGLYDVILDSRKPEAKAFRKWITAEVLPQIRKTGGYIPVKEEDDEMTVLAKAVIICQRTIEQKDKLLMEQKPLVQFAKALGGSDASIHVSEMAKLLTENGYEIGRTRFFTWLRNHGYIFKGSTEPMQEWVTKGIFEVKATLVDTHHGAKESITPMITAKGQRYFLEMLRPE